MGACLRTDGRVTIDVFPASSLGSEADLNEGLTIGSIDMIYSGPNFAERAPARPD